MMPGNEYYNRTKHTFKKMSNRDVVREGVSEEVTLEKNLKE